MKKFDYTNKTFIVTGASSGIGFNVSKILVEKYNAKVYAIARNESRLISAKKSLKNGENYIPYVLDALNENEIKNLYEHIILNNIKIDGLVNACGILPKFNSFLKTDYPAFENVMNANFFQAVNFTRIFLPLIKENNGVLINVSSSASLCPFAGISGYSASKAALERFTECISAEISNAYISTVTCGFTKTNILNAQSFTDKEKGLIDKISAKPEKVANVILKKTAKGKIRIVTGIDAKFMNLAFKLFPNQAPKFITKILKKSKFTGFDEIFN